jgi:hypothetical protein
MVATPSTWSVWAIGRRYDVRVAREDFADPPHHTFRVGVQIRDQRTGLVMSRCGTCYAYPTGTYSVYVRFRSKKYQITEILRLE